MLQGAGNSPATPADSSGRIRPDGKISFKALGEIEATGRTTAQVANILRAYVLELYKLEGDKPIDIRVVAYQSKVYYVMGEVSSDKNVKPKIFEIKFDPMVAHGDTSKNVLLQEGDIIYVPPTVLGVVALKIEELLRPIARAFSGAYIMQQPWGTTRYYGGGGGGY